jgi:tape measure domain-containing protein
VARGVQIGRGYIAVDVDDGAAREALSRFGSVAAGIFKTAAVAVGAVSAGAVKLAFDFNSLKEQSLIAFETLLKSGDKAQAMFTSLQKFAAATPFELPGLVDNARQLLGVGVAANQVIPTLQALGDTAGALGINQDHFNNILLAVTQSMGKGKLQGEELMQMVENGIPVWQLLAEATGKPIPELQKMSSEGKLLSQDVLPKLFAQMEKDYGGAMAKQATTLSGVWSSLKDNTKILLGTALEPLFSTVKSGIGELGNLAQSTAAQDWAKNFATGLQGAITTGESFYKLIKDRYGSEIGGVLDRVKEKGSDLWSSFKSDGVPLIKDLASGAAKVVPPLLQLAQAMGGLLRPALEAVRGLLQIVADRAGDLGNLLSTAASVVSGVAGPAIKLFGEVLKIAADLLGDVVHFVADLSGPLGVLTGVVLAGVAAWRILGPAVTAVGTAINAIKPSAIADALTPMTKKIDNVALSAGLMTEKFSGSANAGEKVATAGSKIGTVLQKAGSYLPVVGVGFAAIGAIWESAAHSADALKQAATDIGRNLVVGGSVGQAAAIKYKDLSDNVTKAKTAMDSLAASQTDAIKANSVGGRQAEIANGQYKDAVLAYDTAKKAAADYTAELGPVGVAQLRVQQSQKDYNSAIAQFGPYSTEATLAHKGLIAEQGNLNQAQINAAKSAKTEEQNLYDLTTAILTAANTDLQLRQSQQGVKEAIDNLNKVMADSKHSADDVTNAQLNVEAAMLRSADAARKKGEADAAAAGKADVGAAGEAAYTGEILRMAEAAGNNAPAALQKLVGHLTNADLTAAGATVRIDEAGNAVVHLPDGKEIKVTAENKGALGQIAEVQAKLDEAQKRAQITMTVRLAAGLPAISDLKLKALGGPIRPDGPYMVGEQGPEIIFPDRPGYVATATQSKSILAGANAGSGKVEQNNYFSAPMDENAYATIAAQRMSWLAKTGGR